jgi:hypothetical protein
MHTRFAAFPGKWQLDFMRWWLIPVVVCLISFASSFASAEWKVSGNADITANGLYWTSGPLGPDNQQIRGIYDLKTPVTIKSGRELRLRLLPVIQWDPSNVSHGERFFWTPQEAFVQYSPLPWTMQVGYNVQNWGDTDGYNPLDIVNQRQYFDPLRSEKLGSPTVLVKRDFETFFIEGLYIPRQPQTMLPGENSRWLPREFITTQALATQYGTAIGQLPNNLAYHFVDPIFDHAALQNNFGGRIKFRFPGFDWTLVGFSGASSTPAVKIRKISANATQINTDNGNTLVAEINPDVYLWANYYRVHMGGTSFVWVLGDFLLKGAFAYTQSIKPDTGYILPNIVQENVLALERSFSVGDGTLTAVAQGTYVQRHQAFENNSVSLAQMFDRGTMAGLRWAPNERWTVLGSYLRDNHYHGNFAHGELEHKIADGWKAKVAGDLLDGSTGTPIGTYRKNSRIFLSLNTQL